jgi:hypothetical protein
MTRARLLAFGLGAVGASVVLGADPGPRNPRRSDPCRVRRHQGPGAALGRSLREVGQGADAPALRQLPSRDRTARSKAWRAAARARSARGVGGHVGRGHALRHVPHASNYDAVGACPATCGGHWRPPPWPGKADRWPRSASRSRTRPRNGGRKLDAIVLHMTSDPLVGWAWAPVRRASPPRTRPRSVPSSGGW